jgi:hypothetical protein
MFSLSSQKMNPPPPQFTITPDEHSSKNVGPNEKNNIIALHSYSLSLSHKDRAQTTHNTTRMSCPEMIVCAHIAQFLFVCASINIFSMDIMAVVGKITLFVQIISPSNYDEEEEANFNCVTF